MINILKIRQITPIRQILTEGFARPFVRRFQLTSLMTTNTTDRSISEARLRALGAMADRLRRESLIATSEAGSGHPTSCLSCAELVSVLFFSYLKFDVRDPQSPHNDRFILSKGHAAPILWAVLAEAGAFSQAELADLRKIDSDLEGHPTPGNPWVDVATGSLGQGLSAGLGMALSLRMDESPGHVWTLLGDGETAEGSVWEAAALAGHYRAAKLTAIIDVNRLGQTEETMYGHDVESYERRFSAFGWHTLVIDGHDAGAVNDAYAAAIEQSERPTAIIASTLKGKGVSFLENTNGHHGKPVEDEDLRKALDEIGEPEIEESLEVMLPDTSRQLVERLADNSSMPPPDYQSGGEMATRKAYGEALKKVGRVNELVVALDGEVKNSTYSQVFAEAFPERFIECYIAEQNMAGMALGMAALGKIPFVSSFACFLTRAADQIRMAGISRGNVKFCGSHCGVSIGQDGPSQMGLEDLALFRAIPCSTVLYPADAVATERLVALAAERQGIVYIRTTRPATPILYESDDAFQAGGSHTLKQSSEDRVTVIAAGITVFEALEAAEELDKRGIRVRVIDAYSIKPLDEDTIRKAAAETGAVVTVEDHYPQGGLGEAVASVLAGEKLGFRKLAVAGIPRSGDPGKLMEKSGISASCIREAIEELVA